MRPPASAGRRLRAFPRHWNRTLAPALAFSATLLLPGCGGGGGDKTPTAPMVLTTVTVSLSATTIQVGQSGSATAAGADQNGGSISTGTVTWSSSSPTVAAISASGSITSVAAGQTTITATAGSKSGQATLTVIPVPVASVAVSPSTASLIVGTTQQLTAATFDASNAALTGRTVTWSTSNATFATVSTAGLVKAIGTGSVTISATSEGTVGTAVLTLTPVPAAMIVSGMRDASTFLTTCPTNDPAYATIKQDFTLLSDGLPNTVTVRCSEPYGAVPDSLLTDELVGMQALRMAYYMSQGSTGKLPWTSLSLYDWMKSSVAGIDYRNMPSGIGGSCCETINGQKFITLARQTLAQRNNEGGISERKFDGVATIMLGLIHEARHANGNGYPHVDCPAGLGACDASYDVSNLGAYGVIYWIKQQWLLGTYVIGYGCTTAAVAQAFVQEYTVLLYPGAFVIQPVPLPAALPYGGPCFPP